MPTILWNICLYRKTLACGFLQRTICFITAYAHKERGGAPKLFFFLERKCNAVYIILSLHASFMHWSCIAFILQVVVHCSAGTKTNKIKRQKGRFGRLKMELGIDFDFILYYHNI